MIRHIVLYKIKKDVDPIEIKKIFEKLLTLKSFIRGIHDFQWGPYCGSSPSAVDYTHVITVDLQDATVFKEYSPHPVHQEVRKMMEPILEKDHPLLMFDFILNQK
ncbi:MAG: Dabb family protein [Chlamydiota bacterium]